MCELLGLSSNLPATVRLSLRTLAAHGAADGGERDGWGVGYYEGKDVRLIKDPSPAGDSPWITFLEEHDIRSATVVAHIRHATAGPPAYQNTQPFVRELAGCTHLFAHNGALPDIFHAPLFRRRRFAPVGETDSEVAFCALLDRVSSLWTASEGAPSLNTRLDVITQFARDLQTLGPANFLYCDSDVLFAHGDRRLQPSRKVEPPGLHVLSLACSTSSRPFAAGGVSIPHADQNVVLLASTPLTRGDWRSLRHGQVVAVRQGQIVDVRSMDAAISDDHALTSMGSDWS